MRSRPQLFFAAIAAILFAGAAAGALALQDRSSESEWANRDAWQRPQEVMDELGVTTGSAVADLGAGRGYFSFRLAERVGPGGKVYAVDISASDLERLSRRAKEQHIAQIETVRGDANDPHLAPDSVNAILVVNAFHEMREFDAMLQGMLRALKPGGRLAIIDENSEPGKPRDSYHSAHEIPESLVREDAERNGFHFLRRPRGFTHNGEDWNFLLFEKPVS